jgi:nitroimidazol reductase NimA-like FMN-containing flavoprotein (pyridoxamine 5'-phosphate oxidase superfamily)
MQEFDDSDIEAILRRETDGVLAFASDDEPYAIPISFGYDGAWVVFQFSKADAGEKMRFIEDNPEVVLVVYDTNPNHSVESVVARGTIRKVPDEHERAAFGTLQENAEFPLDGSIWGQPPEDSAMELYMLEPHEITGRSYGTGSI